jgi:predicted NBD/HSP70 family sugar kinase
VSDESKAGTGGVRQHNLALVLQRIGAAPRSSRAQVAAVTGLSRATVSALVDDLLAARLITELAPERNGRGRPGNPLQLASRGVAIGVEINVDYLAACVTGVDATVLASRTVLRDNRRGRPGPAIAAAGRLAAAVAADVAAQDGPDPPAIRGIAVALPGIVGEGRLLRAPNLPDWTDRDVAAELARALPGSLVGVQVTLDNEANFAALAHLAHSGPEQRDFVLVSGEIGVGGGLVLDGELFRGVRGYAGEIGHMVVDPRGPRCHCGATGCLEQVAGQEALLRGARIAWPADGGSTATGNPNGAVGELLARAEAGDRRTRSTLHDAGVAIGVALAGVVNVVDVPAVVLGGLYARLGAWLAEPIAGELDRRVLSRRWTPTAVHVSPLGAEAAVRGAAESVIARILTDPVRYGGVDA